MSGNPTWDKWREELRETLRNRVSGEIRLAHSSRDDILEICDDVLQALWEFHIKDECPEYPTDEFDTLIQFAASEVDQAAARHAAEQEAWPRETDCDRLDRVEADLRNRGILLWQVSPCCDSCTVGELPERIDEISRRHPGFRDRVRGYAFFIDQNMAEMLAESTRLCIYLGYGCLSPAYSDVAPDVYERNALAIAQEVCDCLREHGFEPEWDGDLSSKIGVSLNWQRRTMVV